MASLLSNASRRLLLGGGASAVGASRARANARQDQLTGKAAFADGGVSWTTDYVVEFARAD
jgi:hypothetical protein